MSLTTPEPIRLLQRKLYAKAKQETFNFLATVEEGGDTLERARHRGATPRESRSVA